LNLKTILLLSAASFALVPGLALAAPAAAKDAAAPADAPAAPAEEAFTTGVAKGRDRLDSATSTSALRSGDIQELSTRSLGEILRNIPGIRAEYAGGEGNANYSIRGLPLSGTGSKFVQLQEDGLPVLEFGDLQQFGSDMFMRADLNLSAVEAIRGGSASTFASNSPGGVLNLISKTGDVEGGAVQGTLGLNYGEKRVDGEYGYKLSDTLRVHVGGFYRQGEGPRNVGFDAYKGGQIKVNVTKTFENGYVRFYGKWLDDRTPSYQQIPIAVSGTNASPSFGNLANFNIQTDSLLSRNNTNVLTLDGANNIKHDDASDGQHAIVKSVGFEAQFDVRGWSLNDKFRFSAVSGGNINITPLAVAPAAALTAAYGGPGGVLSYATGPQTGQVIASPAALNGNGLMTSSLFLDSKINSLDNFTNDMRANRVWNVGGGELTATAGFYTSSQDYNSYWSFLNILTDVRGDGGDALLNVKTAAGVSSTQDGYLAFGIGGGLYHRSYDVNYGVNAPYGSVNYHIGKLAIGGSVRYDMGTVRGTLYGVELGGGRVGVGSVDLNADGKISAAETKTATLPLGRPGLVDYDYHYLSYSVGANYRIAEPLAVFARYSVGGRAAADKILFTAAVNYDTGKLVDQASAYDEVKQTELGLKFRKSGMTLNITGFSANTGERNVQVNSKPDGSIAVENIVRAYEAKGVEVEAGFRRGAFSVTAGATYTKAKIGSDALHPTFVGNIPRHQADLIFEVTPQVEMKYATVGVNLIGTTDSYAQDTNQLKLPGYALVNAFVQIRPMERVQLMLNVNNLFDKLAIADVTQATIPASGVVLGRAYSGRTLSATLRYAF
jgi:outer membrane receptor protein involved in Fe transport